MTFTHTIWLKSFRAHTGMEQQHLTKHMLSLASSWKVTEAWNLAGRHMVLA